MGFCMSLVYKLTCVPGMTAAALANRKICSTHGTIDDAQVNAIWIHDIVAKLH